MQVTLLHQDLRIEVFDDSAFFEAPDSPTHYDKVYQREEDKAYKPSSQHAIIVYQDEEKLASAILLGAAGATAVSEDAMLCGDMQLIIRCCNIVYGLSLPELQINWKTEADWATCRVEQALGDDKKYGNQNTDGSTSIRDFLPAYRNAGATVRALLEDAAAKEWGVAKDVLGWVLSMELIGMAAGSISSPCAAHSAAWLSSIQRKSSRSSCRSGCPSISSRQGSSKAASRLPVTYVPPPCRLCSKPLEANF